MATTAVPSASGPDSAGSPAPAPRARGLAGALLAYVVAVTVVVTLVPFDFEWPAPMRWYPGDWTVLDLVANVLLFVPLGFLGAMEWPRLARDGAWRVVAAGALASLLIECAQLLAPDRYSSPWDVLTNATGAWLGARALVVVQRRLDPATVVGRMALQLPLVGLVHLLIPLGWLCALSVGANPMRPLLLFCLGLFGASVLGAVQRRHFGPAGAFSPGAMALVAAGWFLVASLPALNQAPAEVGLVAVVVALFAWHRSGGALRSEPRHDPPGAERRFERDALVRASPFLAAYLLLLPLTEATAAQLERHLVLRVVETMTAFTLLGYAAAEAMGRRELAMGAAAWRVAVAALPIAVGVGILRAAGPPPPAELPRILAAVVAAVYGGWLYDVQRRKVREMLGRG